MQVQVFNRFTRKLIFEMEAESLSLKEALELEVKSGADLREADLWGADLKKADLREANLYGANLCGADLSRANLYGANLGRANLYGADLRGATLRGANLYGADLGRANLIGADLPYFQIPSGDLIVWGLKNGALVEMLVPFRARRTACLINRKCRAEFVITRSIDGYTDEGLSVSVDNNWGNTRYTVGEETWAHEYCDDIRIDCSPGIHFFTDRREAEAWR